MSGSSDAFMHSLAPISVFGIEARTTLSIAITPNYMYRNTSKLKKSSISSTKMMQLEIS
jgi:hypothetical protein